MIPRQSFRTDFPIIVLLTLIVSLTASEKLTLHFFGSPTCGECLEVKESVLFRAQKSYPEKIDLRIHDIDTDSGFSLLLRMEETYGVAASSAITMFFPDTFLTGAPHIMAQAPAMIKQYLANPQKWQTKENRTDRAGPIPGVGRIKKGLFP